MNVTAKLALDHLKLNEVGIARRLVASELERKPLDSDCWLALGIIQAESRDYDYAAQSLEKYLHCLKAKHDSV